MPYKLIGPGKRGPSWYVRGTINGRRFEVSTGEQNRQAAEAFALEYVARLGSAAVPGKDARVGFARAAQAYIAFRRPEPYDLKRIDKLCRHFGNRDVRDISHADLVAAANELCATLSNDTKNRDVMTPGSAVLHYAADQRWCSYQRFRRFKTSRLSKRQPASDDTMQRLIALAEGHERLLLALLFETGLRITDAITTTEAGLDLANGRLLARVNKTGNAVWVPLSPDLVVMFANAERFAGYLFPWRQRWRVYPWLRKLCERAGVEYTPHLSRHALATFLGRAGVPDRQAADHGAWDDHRSLHRYQHVTPEPIPDRTIAKLGVVSGARAKRAG